MIKWPEPVSLLRCHTAQEAYHYTESQLKQAVRDALEMCAKVCDDEPEEQTGECGAYESSPYACANAIRALIKEI